MDSKQSMKILIPIDWSENAQKAFNCEWYIRLDAHLLTFVHFCMCRKMMIVVVCSTYM